MIISKNDKKDCAKINKLRKKIDTMNKEYLDSESDIIFKQQPFLLSLILGHRYDLEMAELGAITKIYFLIWEYFKNNKKVKGKKISEKEFEVILIRNINMLKYLEEEKDTAQLDIISSDLGHLESKSLLTAILLEFKKNPLLKKIEDDNIGKIVLVMKSLIECFENLARK